jgi:hypothetical protein
MKYRILPEDFDPETSAPLEVTDPDILYLRLRDMGGSLHVDVYNADGSYKGKAFWLMDNNEGIFASDAYLCRCGLPLRIE